MDQDSNAEASATAEQGSEGAANPAAKPPYTYAALIASALRESPEGRLPLRGIYRAIAGRFPYYRLEEKGWQNSVRHNLSLNECFLKVPAPRGEGKRGNLWSLHPAFQDAFEEGKSRGWRRRARGPRADPPTPPFPCRPPIPPPSAGYHVPASAAAPRPYSVDGYSAHPPLFFPSGVETFDPLPPFSPIAPQRWVWREGPYSPVDL